ncbi:MAG: von Willebrand factor type A domain-containing protein [Dysgonamonadaceae bacterium]|jgi:Ca-activated chloride channel family protein|nr:von Willebrand factor type A domain-containing protein [Dysgonamonadaceae bacterium]
MKATINKIGFILLAMGFSLALSAQQMEVSGTVYNSSDKQPLIGVSVTEKGRQGYGVVTDVNGKYRIRTTKGKTLVFSYLGMVSKELKVSAETLDVYLDENKAELEEVVVVGYGTQKKSTVTGAVTSIDIADLRKHKVIVAEADNTLAGNISGLVYAQEESAEEYGSFKENRFQSATDQPLSTFSLDVDAASYGNIRRIINQGQMPRKDAVRVEEMINYFSYNYPKPKGEHPVNIVTETSACPWNAKHKLFRIGVKAKEIESGKLPASNFVFLIDVSGSMFSANKLPLVKSSLKLLVNNLRDKDRVSIVVYAGAAGEVLPSTTGADKQKIIDALEALQAGGSTAGGAGIALAYKIAEKNFVKGGNNRVILCSDGDFNVGVSSTEGLESLIETKRKSGIFLTVLGYGMGNYKDNKLQVLAQKGNGNHAYIDNIQEANKMLVNEFGGTMYAVAKDVKIQVEFNPAFVGAYRLVGYETRLLNKEDFNDDSKDAGELGAGHTVTVLYEIVPVGVESPVGSVDKLKYQTNTASAANPVLFRSNELLTVKLRYKNTDDDKSRKMEIPVLDNAFKLAPSKDFSFAAAVAMFGQLLRDSDFKGDATYDKVIECARKGLDDDANGYRHEFIRLADAVKQLTIDN